jgi:hypothetical protein
MEIHAHALEIADLRWATPDEVDSMMREPRPDLTPWFRQEWELLRDRYADALRLFLGDATESRLGAEHSAPANEPVIAESL